MRLVHRPRGPRPALLVALLAVAACSSARDLPDTAAVPRADAGSVPLDASADDATAGSDDAATGADDAATAPGGPCSFNDDCDLTQRGACSGGDCACEVGPRGTGVSGVTACADGNDCASAVCLEGPGDDLVCSSACDDPTDCPPALPRCLTVPFVGSS